MKKSLVMLALVASGFAFADAPVSAQPQPKPQAPASQPAKAAPAKTEVKAEVKLVADKIAADKKEKKDEEVPQTVTPIAAAPKAKVIMVNDVKACPSCPNKKEKEAVAVESKDSVKTPAPAQTAAKTPAAPKIALA